MRKFLAGVGFYFLGFTLQPSDAQLQQPAAMPPAVRSVSPASQSPDTASVPIAGGAQPQAISLPHIADRAQELNHLLREIAGQLEPPSELLQANQQAETQTAEIRGRALQAKDLLVDNPTPMELEDEQRYWFSLSDEYRDRRKVLAAVATKLQEQIQVLDTQLPEWEATWESIRESTGIDAVLEQVRKGLEAIRDMRAQVNEQLKLILTVQSEVSQQDQQISDVLVSVRQLRERELSYLLEPDSPPLWRAGEQSHVNETVRTMFYRSWPRSLAAAQEFLKTHKGGMLGVIAIYLVALLGVCKLRQRGDGRTDIDVPSDAIRAMRRPYSLALLLALVSTVVRGLGSHRHHLHLQYALCDSGFALASSDDCSEPAAPSVRRDNRLCGHGSLSFSSVSSLYEASITRTYSSRSLAIPRQFSVSNRTLLPKTENCFRLCCPNDAS